MKILLIIAVVLLLLFLFHRGNTKNFFSNFYASGQNAQGQVGYH